MKVRVFIFIWLVFVGEPLAAQDPKVKDLKEQIATKKAELAKLEAELLKLEPAAKLNRDDELRKAWTDKTEKERNAKIENAIASIADADKAIAAFKLKNKAAPGPGTAPYLAQQKATQELQLARAWEPRTLPAQLNKGDVARMGTDDGHPIFTVVSVVDGKTVVASFGKVEYWIEGLGTSNIVDGSKIPISNIVECLGTRKYGGSTIRAIRVLPE